MNTSFCVESVHPELEVTYFPEADVMRAADPFYPDVSWNGRKPPMTSDVWTEQHGYAPQVILVTILQ